jgi:hypothetical protein
MQLRETLLNLAITCVLVLIVVLVAIMLRESKTGTVPTAIPVSSAGVPGGGIGPLEGLRPVEANFVSFPGAEFVESRTNEPDAFRLKIGTEEFIFVLYFVDALEASWTHPQRVAEQARWFGNTQNQAIVDGGVVAMNYVAELLKTKPFTVLTRWERVPNSSRYYALINVQHEPGKRAYLADLLVRKGYARIHGINTFLPSDDSRRMEDYLVELNGLAKQARLQKQGIWTGK